MGWNCFFNSKRYAVKLTDAQNNNRSHSPLTATEHNWVANGLKSISWQRSVRKRLSLLNVKLFSMLHVKKVMNVLEDFHIVNVT